MTPVIWVCNDDGARGAELRADGWPICPFCEEDELYSLSSPPTVDTIVGCYRCGPKYVVESGGLSP